MANTNCLEGFKCKCGSEGPFDIEITAWARVSDDGTDDYDQVDWSDDSVCVCVACKKVGRVKDFKQSKKAVKPEKKDADKLKRHRTKHNPDDYGNLSRAIMGDAPETKKAETEPKKNAPEDDRSLEAWTRVILKQEKGGHK